MKPVLAKLFIFCLACSAGIGIGLATHPSALRAQGYCEQDECRWVVVCHDTGTPTGCDMNIWGFCTTYVCE